jgi:hypothetical protein
MYIYAYAYVLPHEGASQATQSSRQTYTKIGSNLVPVERHATCDVVHFRYCRGERQ